ncbi:MAG: hypothetical protein HQL08_16145 [Nitrospirae bacterium]|nr:hypothetical protein [Nitrospirota bacterium]
MEPRDLTPYERLALRMFDDCSNLACNGIMYNCKLLINCSPSNLDLNCITWVSMN